VAKLRNAEERKRVAVVSVETATPHHTLQGMLPSSARGPP